MLIKSLGGTPGFHYNPPGLSSGHWQVATTTPTAFEDSMLEGWSSHASQPVCLDELSRLVGSY